MKKVLTNTFSSILFFLSLLVFLSTNWAVNTFGLLSPDVLIYQLREPLRGTASIMITNFIKSNVVVAAIITAAVIILFNIPPKTVTELRVTFFHFEKSIHIRPIQFVKRHIKVFISSFLIFCVLYSFFTLDINGYVKEQLTNSSFIQDNYVDPKTVLLTFPEEKRNLIYIYLESMETTYFSKDEGGAQSTDLMPELYNLQQKNINFSNTEKSGGAFQVPGTDYTVAGMVAQTSGLPLLIPVSLNSCNVYESFFSGAYSLGNALQKNGYHQVLLLGSDATFESRESYFTEHGNYDILDYKEAIKDGKIPKNYYVWWGYEDEKLFSFAKQELTTLSQSSTPFNLTFLTADTHFPEGYLCGLCKNEHDSQYANVISCSSRQVADFVAWVQQQSFYKNTTIIINGDHLSMNTSLFKNLDPSYERTTLNMIINSPIPASHTKDRTFCTFDMFPTTLAALGVQIKGDKLGLGTNLFSGVPTLAEKCGKTTLTDEFNKKSNFYDNTILY